MGDEFELDESRRVQILKRELRRMRASPSFRVGTHLINAIERPWKLLLLPFTFPNLIWTIGLEKLGLRAPPDVSSIISQANPPERCVVMFPTNGVGFGHFTRMFAVARQMQKKDPSLEVIFFTTMPTLHIPYLEGYPTYHLAGAKKFHGIGSNAWNNMTEEMLTLVLDTHSPHTFIFDGAFPYRGMLNAISNFSNTRHIWLRRGTFKKGSSIPVDSIEHFDLIVHPDDVVPLPDSEVDHEVRVVRVAPITLIDQDGMMPRGKARARLGVPNSARAVYVQLGAGQINDIDSEVRMVVESLLEYEDVIIILGESMLGERLDVNIERVHLLRDYPNTVYFNAIDFAVQAGGYNSFHEMRNLGIPTMFLPNMKTGMDDQAARCRVAEQEGWGLSCISRNKRDIENGVSKLLKLSRIDNSGIKRGEIELRDIIVDGI